MKNSNYVLLSAVIVALTICITGCDTATKNTKTEVITNPLFAIAPTDYSVIAEKALTQLANFDYDAWGQMLADNVEYSFPDGDNDTRTKLVGKAAVVGWWKGFRKDSGISSMTMSEFNHFPLDVIGDPKGGAVKGFYVFSYFSNKMVFRGNNVGLRMNFVTHFNADKKIDRYVTYYDRTPIIKAMGKNLLEKK